MPTWDDREDYRPPCRDFPLRVDRESYSDEVMNWTSRPRVRSARTSQTTASAAGTRGRTVLPPSSVPLAAASGAAGMAPSPRTTCEQNSLPNTRISSVGEQADYEIDRRTGEPHADFGSRWSDFWLPTESEA